jgi:DNA-binding beta-propeller fold protein YncE
MVMIDVAMESLSSRARTRTVGTVTVGVGPRGVAFDGANIWVANNAENLGTTVSKIVPF